MTTGPSRQAGHEHLQNFKQNQSTALLSLMPQTWFELHKLPQSLVKFKINMEHSFVEKKGWKKEK